jgi:HAD superfamily hydrolase (TIGR01509 family)
VAFNAAFEAFGLPDRWDQVTYRRLLAITGGERRIFGWLSSPASSCRERPEVERRELARALHRWKTDRVEAMAAAGEIPPREGVMGWLDSLSEGGVRLAVATTGSRQWALPLLDKVFGLTRFETVVAGDDVAHRKPDPEAYLVALAHLRVAAAGAVAIEDSGPGFESARGAGLSCVVVANDETDRSTVAGADLILEGFDPEPYALISRVLARSAMARPRGKLEG